jgi:hypothetical protein
MDIDNRKKKHRPVRPWRFFDRDLQYPLFGPLMD